MKKSRWFRIIARTSHKTLYCQFGEEVTTKEASQMLVDIVMDIQPVNEDEYIKNT